MTRILLIVSAVMLAIAGSASAQCKCAAAAKPALRPAVIAVRGGLLSRVHQRRADQLQSRAVFQQQRASHTARAVVIAVPVSSAAKNCGCAK